MIQQKCFTFVSSLLLGSSGGLTLLLDDTRHFLALALGTDVGTKALLEEAEATLV